MVEPGAEVHGDIADSGQHAFLATRHWQGNVDPGAGIAAFELRAAAGAPRVFAGNAGIGEARLEGRRNLTGGKAERPPGQGQQRRCRIGCDPRAVRPGRADRWQWPGDGQYARRRRANQTRNRQTIRAPVGAGAGDNMAAIQRQRRQPFAEPLVERRAALDAVGAADPLERVGKAAQGAGTAGRGEHQRIEPGQRQRVIARESEIGAQRAAQPALAEPGRPAAIDPDIAALGNQRAEHGGIGIACERQRGTARLDEAALALGQSAGVLDKDVEIEAARALDRQQRDLCLARDEATARRNIVFAVNRPAGEVVLEDEVDYPLVRRIAIAQRDLFGQHFHAPDGLRREVAHFPETADALAVHQDDRLPAAPAPAPGLR